MLGIQYAEELAWFLLEVYEALVCDCESVDSKPMSISPNIEFQFQFHQGMFTGPVLCCLPW